MKIRSLSVLLAAALPFLPLARTATSSSTSILPQSTVALRLLLGAVAGLGAFDSVSGASTVISSPSSATGYVGQAFSYRITVGPHSASIFKASPLPDGLYTERSFILGVPTTPGVTDVQLTASDGSHSTRKWIKIHIIGLDGPPAIVRAPQSADSVVNEPAAFGINVVGAQPISFEWFFNDQPISGATSSNLVIANSGAVSIGSYHAVASNPLGKATSAVARLYERTPIIDGNSEWRFYDLGRSLGTKWRFPTYADSSWASGLPPFGYGWADEQTTVSPGPKPGKFAVTTYFRHTVVIPDASLFAGYKLAVQADDGAAVYINGTEMLRDNLPTKGNVSPKKVALVARNAPEQQGWTASYLLTPALVTGTNVIAVEVHQAKTNGADLRFDFELSGLR